MPANKQRLDLAVVETGLAQSRQRAKALIMEGKILVNDQPVDKPGTLVSKNDHLFLKGCDIPYVSRGGLKLASALKAFDINVDGFSCLDVGASTGGFTDCLLQQGAERVFAVDVGYGQLAWKLRQDSRVIIIERTNIRHMPLNALPCPVDLITIDVSFISLKIVVPAVMKFMKKVASIVALIKPQFEVGRGKVGKGGVVRNPDLHNEVISEVTDFFIEKGFLCKPVIPSPILGPKGNREFFIHLNIDC
ncbi:MAG: TlyA family RNA methyltransferase [Desulfobacterales bacterium]|nr:TlyA family RNA methyltransferase [Desulfobacterales bacterium]MDX2508155.1 TlyA family RNA methyltransferase [Desulfobacterales bacterium]